MAKRETIETQTAGNQFLPLINQVLQNTIVSPHNPRLENTSGGQSEASIQVTWPVSTNQRPVLENTSADPRSEAQEEQIFPAEGKSEMFSAQLIYWPPLSAQLQLVKTCNIPF